MTHNLITTSDPTRPSGVGQEQEILLLTSPPSGTDPLLPRRVALLVNEAYQQVESFWVPGTRRTSVREVSDLADSESLVLAEVGGSVVGCVAVRLGGSGPAQLGMLAVANSHRRRGVGEALIAEAERRAREAGHREMQLEVLTPRGTESEPRTLLAQWYESKGYQQTGTVCFEHQCPDRAAELAVLADFVIMRKALWG